MFKLVSKLSQKSEREDGQGLVEYALILVLVSVVVIVILSQVGPGVGNIFSQVVGALDGNVAVLDSTEPGDHCVDYYDASWHYIWRYDGGGPASDVSNWTRVAEPGGSLPLCAWSGPDNGSR